MRERGILFSAPMVRAVLRDIDPKTQTRRAVKATRGRPIEFLGGGPRGGPDWNNPECWGYEWHDGAAFVLLKADPADPDSHSYPCPYGVAGDRLWVRETFQPLYAEGFDCYTTDWHTGKGYAVNYVATDGRIEWIDGDDNITDRCKPGIHMPRWASRITLEITAVRVERLQSISEADAIAEGIERLHGIGKGSTRWRHYGSPALHAEGYSAAWEFARNSYASLWERINGDGSWDANPWVWVIEFKRVAP